MNILSVIMLIFSVLAALDRLFGSRLGLGKEFEKGFMIFGSIALSMVGMIVIAPVIAQVLEPVFDFFYNTFHIDPSIIPASLFANDMGGASVAKEIARDTSVGMLNGMVVSSMMGCTVSFTIPVSMEIVKKERHRELFLGMACGIIAIPVGCFVSGLLLGIYMPALLLNLLPLVCFSVIIACGLIFAPEKAVKIFSAFGYVIKALIMLGLVLGIFEYFTGIKPIGSLGDIGEAGVICFNAVIVLSGAFPFMYVASKLLKKPLKAAGRLMGISEVSTMGFLSSLVTSLTMYESMKDMDQKGAVLNSAFAVSAAFVFGGQLAFTMAFDRACVPAFMVGKLISGIAAFVIAFVFYRYMGKKASKA